VLEHQIEERVAVEQADVALGVGEVARPLGQPRQRRDELGSLVADRPRERLHLGRPDVALAVLDLHRDDRRVEPPRPRQPTRLIDPSLPIR
jgi:hypothetical protein